MHTIFSIKEAVLFGWEKTKAHNAVLFQALLTLFGLYIFHLIISKVLIGTITGVLAGVLVSVATLVFETGLLLISLHIARGKEVSYREIIPPAKTVLDVFLASVLTSVLVFAGLILLIVPGIYFAVRFSIVSLSILDGAGIMEAFEKSTKLTDGHKWPLLGFLALILVANTIGALLFMVGLFVTVPVSLIAYAYVYNKLKHAAHGSHELHSA